MNLSCGICVGELSSQVKAFEIPTAWLFELRGQFSGLHINVVKNGLNFLIFIKAFGVPVLH
jgi:hypothetical protein